MNHQVAVDTRAVERYCLEEMPVEERDLFEEHLFECEVCAADVRAAEVFRANARAVFEEQESNPGQAVARPPARPRASWFDWMRPVLTSPAFAAVLLLIAGWESLVVVPRMSSQLKSEAAPRQVVATVLRPQTRGAGGGVVVDEKGPVEFTFEAPEPRIPKYDAEIDSSSGAAVMHVSLEAPAPDEPLSVLIPEPKFRPGKYVLILRAAGGGPEVGRYHFEVTNRSEHAT